MKPNQEVQTKNYYIRRVMYYWISFIVGYVFPFVYFLIRSGVTKQSTKIVMPTLIAGIFLVMRLTRDIPEWTRDWQPSFWKGLLIGLPKIILFLILMAIGGVLSWVLKQQIETAMYTYFEVISVMFGAQSVAAVINAFHLKYKQLDLIEKGYVLGVVNK